MPAQIILNQPTKPPGGLGKGRRDLATGLVVTASNNTVEGTYLWTLEDVPIRSALVRGTTGVASTFTFTPDVKGTYLLTLQVNGSTLIGDNDQTIAAVVSFGAKTLGWRYLGAGEQDQADNIDRTGLGFPGNTNTRGWSTEQDLQFEQTETATYDVLNAITVSPGTGFDSLTRIDPLTGKLDPSVVPGGGGGGGSNATDYIGALNEREDVLGVERVTGGFKLNGSDIASGRVLQLACIADYVPTAASGQAILRLYDIGGVAPAAGILRSQIIIPFNTGGLKLFVTPLTVSATPGVNTDEVFNALRKYEMRLILDSVNPGDAVHVLWGGVRAEFNYE